MHDPRVAGRTGGRSPGVREEPTRAEALVRLHAFARTHALDDLHFSTVERGADGEGTLRVDLQDRSELTPAVVTALLWIQRCARARGMRLEVLHPPTSSIADLRRVGLVPSFPGSS